MASNPPSIDIKDHLVAQGVGTFAATTGWSINISKEIDEVNQTITLYDQGGPDPNPKWKLEFLDVQIRVKSDPYDYQNGYSKAQEIKNTLLGLPRTTINTTVYVGVFMQGDINFIEYDDRQRPLFTMTFRVFREPTDSSNRSGF